MRLTVGPLPSAVYWRRRALVLGAIVLALFLVAQACMAASASSERGGSPPTTQPPAQTTPPPSAPPPTLTPTPPPTQLPTLSPTAPPATSQPPTQPAGENVCTNGEMRITAVSDLTEFRAGESVQFTIRIRNGGDRACDRDIGGSQRELFLRRGSGAEKVWSSRDCDPPTGEEPLQLQPGFERSHWTVWNGRSSDRCEGGDPAGDLVAAGDYELVARLATDYSEPVAITVTG